MLKVTEEDVDRIIELTTELQSIRYIPARKKALASAIEGMAPTEKWLLTLLCWHCLFNSKFKAIDADRLCLYEPPSKNDVTFQDFLEFLRRHKGINISPSREKPLLKLLAGCDLSHRSFYLSLMTKQWINFFPVVEVQTLLDLDSISGEKVYGELEYLKTSFSNLSYPVSLRKVSSKKLTPYLTVKEPLASMLLVGKEYKRIKMTEQVKLDLKLSTTPRFVTAGFFDEDTYYPTDYFSSWEECAEYMEGDDAATYSYRLSNLNSFLDRSILVYSDSTKAILADNEQSMFDAINKLAKEGTTDILVSDVNSTRTGESYRLVGRSATGIIEEVDETSVSLWFNGKLLKCAYKFEGKEQALLASPEVLKNKVMEFYFVNVGNTEYCFGKGIGWHLPRWRERRLRSSKIWIDKCAMCGSTKHKHANRGVCKSCEANLYYYFVRYGVDTWIQPSPQMASKRYLSVWESSILNIVEYKYKETTLESREDGCWRFKQGAIND